MAINKELVEEKAQNANLLASAAELKTALECNKQERVTMDKTVADMEEKLSKLQAKYDEVAKLNFYYYLKCGETLIIFQIEKCKNDGVEEIAKLKSENESSVQEFSSLQEQIKTKDTQIIQLMQKMDSILQKEAKVKCELETCKNELQKSEETQMQLRKELSNEREVKDTLLNDYNKNTEKLDEVTKEVNRVICCILAITSSKYMLRITALFSAEAEG